MNIPPDVFSNTDRGTKNHILFMLLIKILSHGCTPLDKGVSNIYLDTVYNILRGAH